MLRRTALLGPLLCLAPPVPAVEAPALGVTRRALRFPMDFGAHPDTRIEWWYATGALGLAGRADGPHYGFQLTFFRSRTGVATDHPSRFAAQQLVFAHAAISDLAAGRLLHDQRVARTGFGIAEAAIGDTRVQLRDWRFHRTGPATDSRYEALLDSADAGLGMALSLRTSQPLLLQGSAGFSRKGPGDGQASHYYSQPQLVVSGQIRVDGRRLEVQGRAWLDHEWSDSLLAPEAVGWDWMGINLDDGSALTAFRLRTADGNSLYAGGSFRAPGGAVRSFAPDELRLEPGRRWTSPQSQASYPVAWTVSTPVGRYTLEAAFDDQELDSRRSTGAIYWEGLSRLRDASGRAVGIGYLEMTGYAARLRL